MLFRANGLPSVMLISSTILDPYQHYNLPSLRPLQWRQFLRCILCMANYFKFDDFDPDTPISSGAKVEEPKDYLDKAMAYGLDLYRVLRDTTNEDLAECILSKNVPTPELSWRFAMTEPFAMRIPMIGISNRVSEFVLLQTG